jgi:hypothetical protein
MQVGIPFDSVGSQSMAPAQPLPGRLGGAGVVVDMGFPSMLLVQVAVGDVHVLQCRMVVLVGVGREKMTPILSLVQVMRHVVVLVAVLQGIMLVVTLRPRHRPHIPSRDDRLREPTVHPAIDPNKWA